MRRFLRLAAAIALAAALSLVAIAPPAGAGQVCSGNSNTAPDGRIRVNNGQWRGAGSYPVTLLNKKLAKGKSATFDLQWQNISGSTKGILYRLHSVVGDTSVYGVKYSINGVAVSGASLRQGIAYLQWPNGTYSDTLRVVITKKTAKQAAILVRLQGSYLGKPACDGLFPRAHA